MGDRTYLQQATVMGPMDCWGYTTYSIETWTQGPVRCHKGEKEELKARFEHYAERQT